MSHIALSSFSSSKLRFKNRAVVAPMSRVSTAGDGVPGTSMIEYYKRYAAGGFGMIVTEGTYTDRYYAQAYPNQPGITTDDQINGWAAVVRAIKPYDTSVILQLMHGGALSQHLTNTRAPSAIEPMRTMLPGYSVKQGRYPVPQAMNLAEIDEVIEGFVQSAKNAHKSGFSGVEVHAANGYLLDQFITDYTNAREDQFGGPMKNRIRLTAMIIEKIKHVVPEDFIVGVRLSQGKVNDFDYLWAGGLDDGRVVFQAVADAGADYIHFASEGKGFERGCFTRDGESLPRLARELTGLPVLANGGMHDPALAQKIIDDGHADLLALGTGALANPDWPRRLQNGDNIAEFTPALFAKGVTIDAQFAYEDGIAALGVSP